MASSILFTSPFAAAAVIKSSPKLEQETPPSANSSPIVAQRGSLSFDHPHRPSIIIPTASAIIDSGAPKRIRRMGSALDSIASSKSSLGKTRGSVGAGNLIGGECGMRDREVSIVARFREADENALETADPLAFHLTTVVQHSINLAAPTFSLPEEPTSPYSRASPAFVDTQDALQTAPLQLTFEGEEKSSDPFEASMLKPPSYVPGTPRRSSIDEPPYAPFRAHSAPVDSHYDPILSPASSIRPRTSISSLGSTSTDLSMRTSASSDVGSALFSHVPSESEDGTELDVTTKAPFDDDDSDKTAVEALEGEMVEERDEPALRALLSTWAFDANAVNSATIRICPRILLTTFLYRSPGLVEKLRAMGVADPGKSTESLCASLEGAYHARNAYHNFRHAVDVVQAVYCMLVAEGVAPPLVRTTLQPWKRTVVGGVGAMLSDVDAFALLLACAGHDVGHPGLSNAYLIAAHAPLTKVFGIKAVLENFHTTTFLRMLRAHGFGPLVHREGDRPTQFRSVLTGAILATDMGQHFEIVGKLKALAAKWEESPPHAETIPLEDKVLLAIGLIKCGDISNPTRPHHIARSWSSCLLDEWAEQAALETELRLPVSVVVLDPTEQKAQAKSQVGFTDLFVKPLFESMEALSSQLEPFAQACRDGRQTWQKVADELARLEAAAAPPPPLTSPRKASVVPLTLAERRCLKRGSGSSQLSQSSLPAVDEQATPRPSEQARWSTPNDVAPSPRRRGGPKDASAAPPPPMPMRSPSVKNPFATSWTPHAPSSAVLPIPLRIPLPHRASSISSGAASSINGVYSPGAASFFLPRASISISTATTPSPSRSRRPSLNRVGSGDVANKRQQTVKGCGGKCGATTVKCGACAAAEAEERAEEAKAEESWAASRAWSLAWPPQPFRPT